MGYRFVQRQMIVRQFQSAAAMTKPAQRLYFSTLLPPIFDWLFRLLMAQVRQFSNVCSNPPRFVLVSNFAVDSPSRLILVIDIRELLTGAVSHDKAAPMSSTVQGGGKRRELTVVAAAISVRVA